MDGVAGTLDRFRELTSGPPDEVPLALPALLIASAERPEISIDACERRLQDMAETLAQRLRRDRDWQTPQRVVQTVNQLLFTELGFRGNDAHYNSPRNLDLSEVLAERTGIPVTLAIVYVEVCQRAGLDVSAVGLPSHVICRYRPPGGDADSDPSDEGILVDVFNGGALLSVADCQRLVRRAFGGRAPFKPHYLSALTPRQLLQRLLHNLKAGYLQRGDEERAGRAMDFLLALFPWDLDEIRDRGMLRERMGDYPTALSDLEQYVQYRSGARDIQTVTETVRLLRRHASASGDS